MDFLRKLRNEFPLAWSKSGIKLESQVKLGASAEAEDGTKLYTSADAWASGVDVFTYDEGTDTATPAADGEYMLKDGSKLVVEGGMVKEITAPEAAAQTLSQEQIEGLMKQLNDALGATAVAQSALDAETQKTADLQKKVATLEAEVAKFSKLPAAASIKNGASLDKNQPAKKTQISEEQLAKLNKHEQTYITIQNLKHNHN